MSEIIALTYDSAENALQAKQHFLLEREEHELKLEDCEVVFKDEKGNIKFEHELNPAQARKDSACSVGALIGFIFGLPFGVAGELIFPALGSALGYEIGALSVSKSDYGIDEDAVKEIGDHIKGGKGVLFLRTPKEADKEKIMKHFVGKRPKLIVSSISRKLEDDAKHAIEEVLAA